ncbi:cyclic nucleotide-binding domain-containing protein [Patescibacteria group bacterium]|nr:cyclic nucleotide-binding domain-containing protein [Patescibacteria group bacterium]
MFDNKLQNLKKLNFFNNLNNSELKKFANLLKVEKIDSNFYLFNSSDKVENFYIIISGLVEILKIDKNNNENLVTILDNDDFISENALISENFNRHSFSAKTSGEALIYSISSSDFKLFTEKNPILANKILSFIILKMKAKLDVMNKRFHSITSISNIISYNINSPENCFDLVFDKIFDIIPFSKIALFSFNNLTNNIVLEKENGFDFDFSVYKIDKIFDKIIKNSKSVVYNSVSANIKDISKIYDVRNFILSPVFITNNDGVDKIIGFLFLADKLNKLDFTENDRIVIDFISDEVSSLLIYKENLKIKEQEKELKRKYFEI